MNSRLRVLDWDSRHFDCRIARLEGDTLGAEEVAGIDRWCATEQIDCLYFLADPRRPETISTAESNGFGCKDFRFTYEWKSSLGARGNQPQKSERVNVRSHQESDLPALIGIARAAHTESRFFFDRRFDRNLAAGLYETWIRKACANDQVFVGESDGHPAGYLSCQLSDQRSGSIGLVAVDARFKGQGLGRAMMEAALGWFLERGVSDISVVTQGRNVAAHRFYQSAGFLTRSIECWFHKWFSPPASASSSPPMSHETPRR